MTFLITFLVPFGLWMVAVMITIYLDWKRERQERAAEALWRLTGAGEMPTGVLVEEARKHVGTRYIDVEEIPREVLEEALPKMRYFEERKRRAT